MRNAASPDINNGDFGTAVDYLVNLPQVDENKVGIIGICGFGGFRLNAARRFLMQEKEKNTTEKVEIVFFIFALDKMSDLKDKRFGIDRKYYRR